MKKSVNKKIGMLSGFLGVIVLMFALSLEVKAGGYKFYVDVNYSGKEDGTDQNPFNTIGEALAVVNEDDKIYIKRGIYEEQIEVPRDVEVIGEDKDEVIIEGGKEGTTVKLNHKSKLSNVTIKGGRYGIRVPKRAGVKVKKVIVKSAVKNGMVLEGDGKTRKKSKYTREFEDCSFEDNGAKGMYVKKSRFIIEDSEIKDNEEEGIDMRKNVKAKIKDNEFKDNGEGNIEFKLDGSKVKIIDNKIKGAGSSGISVQSYQKVKGIVYIKDNTIKKSDDYAIRCAKMKKSPLGGWSNRLILSGNKFSKNKDGKFSDNCKIDI